MSEGKRATLISFGSQKVSEKRTKEIGKTIRISLVLPQSNEDTCPEFNYKEELAAVKVSYNRKWSRFQGKGTRDASLKYEFQYESVVFGIVGAKTCQNSCIAPTGICNLIQSHFLLFKLLDVYVIIWQIFESADAIFEGYYVKKVCIGGPKSDKHNSVVLFYSTDI